MSIEKTQILASKYCLTIKLAIGEMANSQGGKEMCEINLSCTVMPESKEVVKDDLTQELT